MKFIRFSTDSLPQPYVEHGFVPLYVVVDVESELAEGTVSIVVQARQYGMYATLQDAEAVRASYDQPENFEIFELSVRKLSGSSSQSEQKAG